MTERQAKLLDEAFAAFQDEVGPLVRPEGPGAVRRTVRRRRRSVATTCAAVVLVVAAGPVVLHRTLTGAPTPPSSPTAPASAPATPSPETTPTPSAAPTLTSSATADATPPAAADPPATADPPTVGRDPTVGPPASTAGADPAPELRISAPSELTIAPVDTDGFRRGTLTVTVVNTGDTTVDRPAVVVPSSTAADEVTPEHTAWSCPELSGRAGRVFCLLAPLGPGEQRQVAVPMLGAAGGGPSPDGTVYVRADYDDFSSPGAAATFTVTYAG